MSTISQTIGNTPRRGAQHYSPCSGTDDHARQAEQQYCDDVRIYVSLSPSPQSGDAACLIEGILARTEIDMVQNPETEDRLGYQSLNFIT